MSEENFVRARTILPEKYSLHDGLGAFSHPKCHFLHSEHTFTKKFSYKEHKFHFALQITQMFQGKSPAADLNLSLFFQRGERVFYSAFPSGKLQCFVGLKRLILRKGAFHKLKLLLRRTFPKINEGILP